MERRFFEQITKGYLIDHDIYGEFNESQCETIYSTVLNELNYINDHIYEIDLDLYNTVYEMSKIHQQRVFEIYLNSLFSKDSQPLNEVINRNPTSSTKNTSLKLSATLGIAGLITWLTDKTFNKVSGSFNDIIPSISPNNSFELFGALGGVADKSIEFISELLQWIPTPAWILLICAAIIKRKSVTKNTFKTLATIGDFGNSFGKFIQNISKYSKFRYAVIQKNREHCYKQCGITNLNQITIFDYFNKHAVDSKYATSNAKSLVMCYIQTEIEKVKLVTRMYFICLKQTGNFDRVKNMNSAKLLSLLKTENHRDNSIGLVSSCGEYFIEITEAMNKIHDLIDFFFENKTTQRELRMTIQKDIDDIKYNVSNMHEKEIRNYRLTV